MLQLVVPDTTRRFGRVIEMLSERGCRREAAVNLFATLRRLDTLGLDIIVARSVPEVELGRAVMDRLRRAAAR